MKRHVLYPVDEGDLVRHKNSGMYFVVTKVWGWRNNPDKPVYLCFAGEPDGEFFRAENYEVVCGNE
jgi:hypothetical protein